MLTPHTRYIACSDHLPGVRWRRSSRSTGMNNCVEAAVLASEQPPVNGALRVAVRDSKNTAGPALLFSPAAWSSFVDAVRAGRFDGRN
ncbi:DUF397 domain-containing protein [Streptomyces sp. 8N616]|uniref:DUF397 domain-containing protein n=1 Tax=Streptomyces sp. 8N616 TaxID=3457414 RepID=UPI003FCF9517